MALNPTAPEFTPFSQMTPAVQPPQLPHDIVHHLPPIVPVISPPHVYYPAPVVVYYQHRHYHHFLPSPGDLSSNLLLPFGDEGLGLITSPTPISPPKPAYPPSKYPQRTRRPTRPGFFRSHLTRPTATSPKPLPKKWVRKNASSPLDHAPLLFPSNKAEDPNPEEDPNPPEPINCYPFGDYTSLMIRNIPVRLSRRELMNMLEEHCLWENGKLSVDEPASEFDFLYLPIDFKKKGNKGYAFVNFTCWQGASRLYNSWEGTGWENCPYNTKKICQIHAAKFQGSELKMRFESSRFVCESDEYLPVEISPPRDGSNAEVSELKIIGKRVYGCLMDVINDDDDKLV